MEKHVKNYMEALGYDKCDTILCEACGKVGVDIHHIEFRSSFGSKRKGEQDAIDNLICLCRSCHDEAHGYESRKIKLVLLEIVKRRNIN